MSRYTYTLTPQRAEEDNRTYKQSELEGMTTFRLREICRKERLVVQPAQYAEHEKLVRLIMRFRGQREYRHIRTVCEGGTERLQEFLNDCGINFLAEPKVEIPGTITLFRGTEVNSLDGYRIKAETELYEGNLLLVDECLQVYTCFYMERDNGEIYLHKGGDVPVLPLEKHQYFILYFPNEESSEFLYDCYYGNRISAPAYIECVRIPLLDVREEEIRDVDLPLVIDFGSSNTTMGICLPDGSMKIASAGGNTIIPSIIRIKEKQGGGAEF